MTLRVIHVGLMGDRPGGMAQVVNEFLSWESNRLGVRGWTTARRRRDPLGPAFLALALLKLLTLRIFARVPTVIAVHLSEGGSFVREGFVLRAAHSLGIPTVAHLHGAEFERFARERPHLVRKVLDAARIIAVLTSKSENVVRELLGEAAIVELIPNLVAVPPARSRKERVVLFCGEVGLRKGADVLLDAWSRNTWPADWSLALAGPVAMSTAGYLPMAGVELLGPVGHDEALALQDRAAIAVLPSRNEALPMFLLEAMARGCAPVSTDVGEVGSLLSDGCGLVVPAGDAPRLGHAIRRLIEDETLRNVISTNARDRISRSYSSSVHQEDVVRIWARAADCSTVQ